MRKITPNMLTAVRLLLFPFLIWCQHVGTEKMLIAAVVILAISEITDLVDGRLARATGQVTEFGKLFDPLTDSLMRLSLFISFAVSGWIPLWATLLIFARDITIDYLRTFYATHNGKALAARFSGKYLKALPQSVAMFALLLSHSGHFSAEATFYIFYIALATTVISGVDYTLAVWKKRKKS